LAQNGQPTEIETYNDHRIAMAFFLAGLRIKGIKIRNPDCVAKSFPNFWEIWEGLGVKFLK
jgi:3-phosphoshikimate 1-carboxyvinyltransferase